MSYLPQTSSHRITGRGRGKVRHKRAKRKGRKHRSGSGYLPKENKTSTSEEVTKITLVRLRSLGDQIFALSPFSQYFDNWLLGLKSIVSEFESDPAVKVDEDFIAASSQVITDIELRLIERRREEAVLEKAARKLAKHNNLLVQIDTEYAYATQKLSSQRNGEIKRLTRRIHDLEEKLEETSRIKAGIFSPFARRAKTQKLTEVTRKLNAIKSKVESTVKAFEVEQEKLQHEYEKRKQVAIEQIRILEKKVKGRDTDGSVEDRQVTCEKLINAVRALFQRKEGAS